MVSIVYGVNVSMMLWRRCRLTTIRTLGRLGSSGPKTRPKFSTTTKTTYTRPHTTSQHLFTWFTQHH